MTIFNSTFSPLVLLVVSLVVLAVSTIGLLRWLKHFNVKRED